LVGVLATENNKPDNAMEMEIGHFQTHLSFCRFYQIKDETFVVLLEFCIFL